MAFVQHQFGWFARQRSSCESTRKWKKKHQSASFISSYRFFLLFSYQNKNLFGIHKHIVSLIVSNIILIEQVWIQKSIQSHHLVSHISCTAHLVSAVRNTPVRAQISLILIEICGKTELKSMVCLLAQASTESYKYYRHAKMSRERKWWNPMLMCVRLAGRNVRMGARWCAYVLLFNLNVYGVPYITRVVFLNRICQHIERSLKYKTNGRWNKLWKEQEKKNNGILKISGASI